MWALLVALRMLGAIRGFSELSPCVTSFESPQVSFCVESFVSLESRDILAIIYRKKHKVRSETIVLEPPPFIHALLLFYGPDAVLE